MAAAWRADKRSTRTAHNRGLWICYLTLTMPRWQLLRWLDLSVVMGWWPTPAHENVARSPGDVGFAWCS
jgi:hypothetical protein